MRFSRLSKEEAREILDVTTDPAYRAMNRVEGELADKRAGTTPQERLEQMLVWLKIMDRVVTRDPPSREIPRTDVMLL